MQKKILVVEDSPDLREIFSASLEKTAGVVYAGTVAEAEEAIRREDDFHLAIIQLALADNSFVQEETGVYAGFYVGEQVRHKYSDIPIIFVTGSFNATVETKLAQFTRAGLLVLPFACEELRKIVDLIFVDQSKPCRSKYN
ncbi:response regulator [candidate division FCPU426 bacterium]|nr:response regulator [candidate division FCPU426 bacterium]